jgi:hypothetical protein
MIVSLRANVFAGCCGTTARHSSRANGLCFGYLRLSSPSTLSQRSPWKYGCRAPKLVMQRPGKYGVIRRAQAPRQSFGMLAEGETSLRRTELLGPASGVIGRHAAARAQEIPPAQRKPPSANSFSHASNRRCCSVCGRGLNSPLESSESALASETPPARPGLSAPTRAQEPRHRPLLTAFRARRRVNARTDFSKCSSLIGSVILARAAPGVNSTTSLAPNRRLANPAIGPGVGARLLRFLEAADERDELPAIII